MVMELKQRSILQEEEEEKEEEEVGGMVAGSTDNLHETWGCAF